MDKSPDKCYICLSHFDQQTVASLEKCQHVFCLDCILQWSQTANTCPVDRLPFAFIHQRQRPGGDVQKEIKVTTPRRDVGDEEEASGVGVVICEECGRSDRGRRLLACTRCDSGYHTHCLTPSLTTVPEGDWICPECAVSPHHTDGSVVEEEISDGELTDLLAEAAEAATAGSRLRPSTMNRPSSSAERRRSARVRSRTSGGPSPPLQTSWHVPKYLLRASKPATAENEVTAL